MVAWEGEWEGVDWEGAGENFLGLWSALYLDSNMGYMSEGVFSELSELYHCI